MARMYQRRDDFEAIVRILTAREGGRCTPVYNGIRWDLRYFHQSDTELSMIWPEFIDENGATLPVDQPLTGLLRAKFYVVADEMRDFHRQQVHPGVGFFCVEGPHVCAVGIITKVTGLAGWGN
jgi:hypothetical protein